MHMVLDGLRMMSCSQNWHRLFGTRCGANANRRAALIKQFCRNLDNSLLNSPTTVVGPEVDEEIKRRKCTSNVVLDVEPSDTRFSHQSMHM